jgi:hypothetical protein
MKRGNPHSLLSTKLSPRHFQATQHLLARSHLLVVVQFCHLLVFHLHLYHPLRRAEELEFPTTRQMPSSLLFASLIFH